MCSKQGEIYIYLNVDLKNNTASRNHMPQPCETSICTPGRSDLPQESNWDCVIYLFIFLRRTKVKTQTHWECSTRSSHWMVLTKFTLLLSNYAHKCPSQQVEALGIPKHCVIQKLIIFNSGGYYMKNIFKIKFYRLPRQKMSL